MMDIQERLAEIARRSDEILCKRRRRKRMALACVPLVLCMAVLAGGYLHNAETPQQEGYAEAVVEVIDGGMVYDIRDPERVTQIGQLLAFCMEEKRQEDFVYGEALGRPETDNGADFGTYPATASIIAVTLSDGTTHRYQLLENQLTDRDTGKTVFLRDEVVTKLKALLDE